MPSQKLRPVQKSAPGLLRYWESPVIIFINQLWLSGITIGLGIKIMHCPVSTNRCLEKYAEKTIHSVKQVRHLFKRLMNSEI